QTGNGRLYFLDVGSNFVRGREGQERGMFLGQLGPHLDELPSVAAQASQSLEALSLERERRCFERQLLDCRKQRSPSAPEAVGGVEGVAEILVVGAEVLGNSRHGLFMRFALGQDRLG